MPDVSRHTIVPADDLVRALGQVAGALGWQVREHTIVLSPSRDQPGVLLLLEPEEQTL